jgi:hypothetical protein
MPHIYALVSGQLILYVGKTTQTLKKRGQQHRRKNNRCCSKYIPEYIDWTIRLLETVTPEKSIEKEKYYYDTLKPLYNYQRPGQSKREYELTDTYKKYREYYENKRYPKEI